jgi:hypothetical protein
MSDVKETATTHAERTGSDIVVSPQSVVDTLKISHHITTESERCRRYQGHLWFRGYRGGYAKGTSEEVLHSRSHALHLRGRWILLLYL